MSHVLQVGIGRLLQEEEHSRKAAVDCSTHERGDAEVGSYFRSMFAPCVSSSIIISTLPLVAAACSRVKAEGRPSAELYGRAKRVDQP